VNNSKAENFINWRINKSCSAYPCHENLEDCTFCYCPFYACENPKRGKYIEVKDESGIVKIIWNCSKCEWIHKKSTVDKIFKEVQKLLKDLEKDDREE
jgi:precorrin-3B C17-methyltransferase